MSRAATRQGYSQNSGHTLEHYLAENQNRRTFFKAAIRGVCALSFLTFFPRRTYANALITKILSKLGIFTILIKTGKKLFRKPDKASSRKKGTKTLSPTLPPIAPRIPQGTIATEGLKHVVIKKNSLMIYEAGLIASLSEDLYTAIKFFGGNDKQQPALWLKDGENPFDLFVTNTYDEPIEDELILFLYNYKTEQILATANLGKLTVPPGKGKKFKIKTMGQGGSFILEGLPNEIQVGTFLQIHGKLAQHPNIVIFKSVPIVTGDSQSVVFKNELA